MNPTRRSSSTDSKLVFINRSYWPDSEATGQLLTELCEFLAPRWDVTAVVGQPNWETEQEPFVRSGIQVRNGVAIHRLLHSQLPKNVGFARIRNLISFTLAVRRWGQQVGKSHFGKPAGDYRGSPNRPILVCETDPFLLPLVVGPMARRSNARMIYYLQDIYPDVAIAVGVAKNSLPIRTLRARLKKEYMQAERIVVLDDDMQERLAGWGVPRERIRIVPNWMDCSAVKPVKEQNAFRIKQSIDDKFIVMHSGNMGMTQRLDVLVEAMKLPSVSPRSLLTLVGNGAKRPLLEKQANGARNIRFMGYQPREMLSESLSAADLHVVSMDQSITGCLAPSKLYGILASGTPVLAIVPKGNAVWRLVERHQLGWNVEPGNREGIANAISNAVSLDPSRLQEIGRRGRKLAEDLYDKQICCEAFEAVLREV
jgi:colanic acid biosynthesis glycosyl transferase WcaI